MVYLILRVIGVVLVFIIHCTHCKMKVNYFLIQNYMVPYELKQCIFLYGKYIISCIIWKIGNYYQYNAYFVTVQTDSLDRDPESSAWEQGTTDTGQEHTAGGDKHLQQGNQCTLWGSYSSKTEGLCVCVYFPSLLNCDIQEMSYCVLLELSLWISFTKICPCIQSSFLDYDFIVQAAPQFNAS